MTKKKTPESVEDFQGFEEKLKSLETLVNQLDSEEVSLQESLDKFESGVKVYKECYDFIAHAEKKIQVLTDSLKLEDYKIDNEKVEE